MSIVISRLRNPYINLSIEHYLFRHTPLSAWPLLYLYVNDPCVVIGRNQNPWREINVPLVKSLEIPVVRRRSGGGTVVHDAGNVNFCVMTSRENFTRDKYARLIVTALNKRIVAGEIAAKELQVNDRYDIVTADSRDKVSGSAYKIERERAYHHGTMLLNSKLDVLKALLHRDVSRLGVIEGRGVTSVKSPVANINCKQPEFINTVAQAFIHEHKNPDDDEGDHMDIKFVDSLDSFDDPNASKDISHMTQQLSTWDWIYGQTPLFTHKISDSVRFPDSPVSEMCFTVDKGHITSELGHGLPYKGQELAATGLFPSWVPAAIDGWESHNPLSPN